MKALNDCVKHYVRVIEKRASQEIVVSVNDGHLRIPIPGSDREIVAEAKIVKGNNEFLLKLTLPDQPYNNICLSPNSPQSLTIDGEEMVFIYTIIGVKKEKKQKCLKPGQAVFLEGSSIQISEPDDWGWFYNFYNDAGEEEYRVVIKVKKTLGRFGKWKAELVEAEDNIEVVLEDVLTKNGLPYQVSARIRKGNMLTNVVTFKRISLKCWSELRRMVELVSDSGYYPTYFFFILGAFYSGKTCWFHALSTPDVQARLRNHGIYNFDAAENEPVSPLRPNCIDEIILKKFFLREDGMTEPQKLVFVADLASEINKLENHYAPAALIRRNIPNYASGIFIVRNEKWLFGETQSYDPAEFIFHSLGNIPACNILTGADRIKKALLEGKEEAVNLNLTPDSPIFRWANRNENMAVSSDIMKRKDEMTGDSPCFTVSCCSDAKDKQENEALDFSEGYNADLPLEYMLQDL